MIALDAPKRDVCVVKRDTTATPLQAFVFMNDPQFVEAARVLAASLTERHEGDLETIINEIFHRLVSRLPSERERKVLINMHQEQRQHFQAHPEQAEAYLKTGKASNDNDHPAPTVAALAVVINALMAYDETVMKR